MKKHKYYDLFGVGTESMKCPETTVVSGIPVGCRNWFIPQWHTQVALNKHEIETQDTREDIKFVYLLLAKKKEHNYCP